LTEPIQLAFSWGDGAGCQSIFDDTEVEWPPSHPNAAPPRPVTPEDPIGDDDLPF
jgi:hypothetical protein